MQRRNKQSVRDTAEAYIVEMEQRATNGLGIKKTAFQETQKALRSSIPLTYRFKEEVVQALVQDGGAAFLCDGEADLKIRARSSELRDQGQEFVVVGNDCDYAIHPTTTILLRPWGRRFLKYDVDTLLAKAGLSRAQYQALGVISRTDYSWNLPGLGIGNNTRIIKSLSDGKFALPVFLPSCYDVCSTAFTHHFFFRCAHLFICRE